MTKNKKSIREALQFSDLTQEEKERRGILGRLYGPAADVIRPTRNGRKYNDQLWEKAFKNELVVEMLEAGGIPGELDHPTDRLETDSEKIAIIMPEAPKRDGDGHLITYFDILDTPCGKIAYQLAKYGYKLGISSRGNGDVTKDYDGAESVDPNTFDLKAFDLVLMPSVKDARLQLAEGLAPNKKSLRLALQESLDSVNALERQIMEDALKDLDLDIDEEAEEEVVEIKEEQPEEKEEISFETTKKVEETLAKLDNEEAPIFIKIGESDLYTIDDIYQDEESGEIIIFSQEEDEESNTNQEVEEEADDVGNEVLVDLQEALKKNAVLGKQLVELQNKLAVSDTKVNKLEEAITRRSVLNKNQNNSTELETKVSTLQENIKQKDAEIKKLADRLNTLVESRVQEAKKRRSLNESISEKTSEVKTLTEDFNTQLAEASSKIKKLEESLSQTRVDSKAKEDEFTAKLAKGNKILESYRKKAEQVTERYIQSKAMMLGVSVNDIKNRLDEKYTVDDIDMICEDLQAYTLRVGNLPISLSRAKKVKVTESKNEIVKSDSLIDDDVDDTLLSLVR